MKENMSFQESITIKVFKEFYVLNFTSVKEFFDLLF